MLMASRGDVAEILWLYGEDELAAQMLEVPVGLYRAVLERAVSPTLLSGQSATLDRTIALGTVEALTGLARPTARQRARPRAGRADFWVVSGIDPATQPTLQQQLAPLRDRIDGPRAAPHRGPWADRGRGRSPLGNGRDGVLRMLRRATARQPYVIFTRERGDEQPYAQTYRLGGGRTMVEQRDGGEETHRHLVAPSTALAADIVVAWLDDADGWLDQPWLPGMPDVKAMVAGGS